MTHEPEWARRLVWAVFATSAAGVVAGGGLQLALLHGPVRDVVFNVSFFSCSVAGLLIGAREPRNRIAWLLLGIGALIAFGSVADPYTEYGLRVAPGSLPAADVVGALSGALWVPLFGTAGTFLILLFPDGRLPTPRWRPVGRVSGVTIVAVLVIFVFSPPELELQAGVANPLAIGVLEPLQDVFLLVLPALPLSMLACAAGLVVRFRRSSGVQRLQLKWLASAGSAVATAYLTMILVTFSYHAVYGDHSPGWLDALQVGAGLTFVLLPLSVGVAISRHGLYGIDRLLSRTVAYALLTGALVVLYAGLVTSVSRLTPRDSSLAVAASTLAVAAAFQPLRRRLQTAVDRRFNRARYDAEQTLQAFRTRLREEVDLGAVRAELLSVAQQTMQPTSVDLWLRSTAEKTT